MFISDEIRPREVTPFEEIDGTTPSFELNFSVAMVEGMARLTKRDNPKTGEVSLGQSSFKNGTA